MAEQKSGNAGLTATVTISTGKKSSTAVKRRPSAQQQQYDKAIALSDADLAATVKDPSERIAQYVKSANSHNAAAKKERAGARREFKENLACYYEIKQRLLNPGYRTDVNGGGARTPSENEKNFGAPDWAAYREKSLPYSLQHADRMLRAFARANGLLTGDSENIGDPEGEVEKQIPAEAEHVPAPIISVPQDLFNEVLSLLSKVSSLVTDPVLGADARQLAARMRPCRPAPKDEDVPKAGAAEEKRKRDRRLEKKNGQPPRGAASGSGTGGTSEYVQRPEMAAAAEGGRNSQRQSEEHGLRKACQQRGSTEKKKPKLAARSASPTVPPGGAPAGHQATQPGAMAQTTKQETAERLQPCMKTPKVTVCPPARGPDAEERILRRQNAAPAQPGTRQCEFVCNELGNWEYDPEVHAKGLPQAVIAPPAAQCAA